MQSPLQAAMNYPCPKCGHVTSKHAFNVRGQTTCADCGNGLCTAAEERADITGSVASLGFSLIGSMGKAELIEEILLAHRTKLREFEVEQLRRMVVQVRMHAVKERLMHEAGVEDEGMFGGMW